jgi:cystathionine beta-synthase
VGRPVDIDVRSAIAELEVRAGSRRKIRSVPPPDRKICDTILDAIGNTPMVRIHNITRGVIDAEVLVKLETFNPGNSIKDRMAVRMIEDAEREGKLKPGGTIIEGTSGNTGMGLAIVAVIKGYKCIFTTTDKQSKEKVDALKAFGAEVIVCPTDVDPEDPRSYYSVSSRLEREIPNSWKANQYDNLSNTAAHYGQTAPEIWDQTGGRITHLVCGVGTGGTISGVGRYLKERNPRIKVWGIDTYGSVFKKYKETGIFDQNEIYPYITEGIGEDFLPRNVDFNVIDHFEKVTDKDAAIMTRRITREEGIFAGNSAGSAMAGLLQLKDHFSREDVIVVIFHDHGSRYLAKMFNDEWMRAKGFLEVTGMTARDLVALGVSGELYSIEAARPVEDAIRVMSDHDFSQLSVTRGGRVIGSLNESHLYNEVMRDHDVKHQPVEAIMLPAFPFVDISTPVQLLSTMITPENPAVLVRDFKTEKTFIITRSDIIRMLC